MSARGTRGDGHAWRSRVKKRGHHGGVSEDAVRDVTAFVGTGASYNDVTVVRGSERLICKTCLRKQQLALAGCFVLGVALLILKWARPVSQANVRSILSLLEKGIIVALLVCAGLLVYNLFRRRRFELVRSTGVVYFYEHGTGEPCMRLAKQEIDRFDVSKQATGSSPLQTVRGYILSAICLDGRIVGLCSSSDRELLRSLRADLENSMLRK